MDKNLLLATLFGGVFSWFFYWIIVAVSQFYFYLMLLLVTTLFFGPHIFSGSNMSKYYSSRFIALLVIVNSAMAADAHFNAILAQRILLISGAIVYMAFAIKLLERFFFDIKYHRLLLQ